MESEVQRVYKLTREDKTTYGGMKWGEGVTHEVGEWAQSNLEEPLCTSAWIHFYDHPLLAVLHNPVHANYKPFLLWEAEARGPFKREEQMKGGCKSLTTIKIIEPPNVTPVNRVAYGIHCALAVYEEKSFQEWAEKWLTNKNRTALAPERWRWPWPWPYAACAAYAAANATAALAAANVAAYAAARRVDRISLAEKALLVS